jgi:hypothetical protein
MNLIAALPLLGERVGVRAVHTEVIVFMARVR